MDLLLPGRDMLHLNGKHCQFIYILDKYNLYSVVLVEGVVYTFGSWWYWHFTHWFASKTLEWRHNGRDSVSNHQPHDCFLNRLFRRRSKKISKLRVTGLCAGNSPVTGGFPAQMASNTENVSIIWWRHHEPPHLSYIVKGPGYHHPWYTDVVFPGYSGLNTSSIICILRNSHKYQQYAEYFP